MSPRPALTELPPLTPQLYAPTPARPVRAKTRRLAPQQAVVPHRHPWAQVAFSIEGVTRLTAEHGTYLVPPSRALWIPPGIEHAVTVLEPVQMVTLYLHQPAGRCGPTAWRHPARAPAGGAGAAESGDGHDDGHLDGHHDGDAAWRHCRVLEVSDLLRALTLQLDTQPDDAPCATPDRDRQALIAALIADELARARPVRLGIALPRDKRLRALCQAVIDEPARHATLAQWAQGVGASPRTLARLFRDELATSFGRWREQVLLAQALALATRGQPVAWIAAELGYASASAFTAMVRRTVGQPPSRFFASSQAAAAGAVAGAGAGADAGAGMGMGVQSL
ncbi:AraC family transcriptional regulator [Aquabacterium sp. OR-4]|uniref:AraC family transcriptional regulator n=1 Tax=Aquabacterium sp. OR-4 TaxID=2978127 RepID=UPI0021B46CF2|nr:helix-turn-helix transcriptional regulator [Aquabacterium sp. OR-4]MDT7835514.1 helix-turn-helix transcriptional regulator [Aquabacterium sp. OR-4]